MIPNKHKSSALLTKREHAAIQIAAGLASGDIAENRAAGARIAVAWADALLDELDRTPAPVRDLLIDMLDTTDYTTATLPWEDGA